MNFKSLSASTLLKMSIRITLVVLVVTVAGYFHLKLTIEGQTQNTLSSYNTEREAREGIIFEEAKQNHQILKNEFINLYTKYLRNPKTPEIYKSLIKKYADGAVRNRNEAYDGKYDPGIFIGDKTVVDKKLMARILAAYDTTHRMGPAYHSRFQDTYFTFPENAIVLFWPEEPRWAENAKASLNIPLEEYAYVSMPERNPQRQMQWTGLFYDKVSGIWMATGSTPIYIGDEFLGSVHHDVMVTELIQRTLNHNIKGAKNYIIRSDGRLIAHPAHLNEIQSHDGKLDIASIHDKVLKAQFETIKKSTSHAVISDDYDNYLAVARIKGPDWYLVSEYPKSIVRKAAIENVGFLLGAGIFSLALELMILFFVLRKEVSRPLLELVSRAKEVAQGNYSNHLNKFQSRNDELGLLATSFTDMIEAVNIRDKMLARHNEDLESMVEERTRELDQQKALNIQASKLSALGEMAGGMAHEVNTPLATIKLLTSQAHKEVTGDIPDLEALETSLVQIDKTVDRVAKIIRGLKSFSRNTSDDPLELSDIQSIVEDTISLCNERCKLHGIDLKVSMPKENIYINCRPAQLCQVLLNLVNNAHDAVEHEEEKWIEIKAVRAHEGVEISVTDSGPGIPKDLKEKIFNPFFTTKAVGKGTGMGLSISHGIVESHSGSLKVLDDSKYTCFVISLPDVKQGAA